MPSPWTELRAAVDPLARLFGYYTAYRVSDAERLSLSPSAPTGTVGARRWLDARGYTPQYLSAAKRHPVTGQLHDLSYRRVPDEHPPEAAGTELATVSPRRCQYHVHFFDLDGGGEWFSHYELRPLAGLAHYRPTYGSTYLLGVTDLP